MFRVWSRRTSAGSGFSGPRDWKRKRRSVMYMGGTIPRYPSVRYTAVELLRPGYYESFRADVVALNPSWSSFISLSLQHLTMYPVKLMPNSIKSFLGDARSLLISCFEGQGLDVYKSWESWNRCVWLCLSLLQSQGLAPLPRTPQTLNSVGETRWWENSRSAPYPVSIQRLNSGKCTIWIWPEFILG